MSFDVGADAYGQFMGRYSEPLAAQFADLAGVERPQRALDVGCGPGALTAVLAERLGDGAVSGVDPSASFVAAVRTRLPGVDVREAGAEDLPFDDAAFDVTLAQLVVHFMSDPVVGIGEIRRVTRSGGLVAACVWDHAGGKGPLATFWQAARDLDPAVRDESHLAGARDGHLVELFEQAGLADVRQAVLTVRSTFADVDAWWHPYTLGVGPAGAYLASLTDERRTALRSRCGELLPPGPVDVDARAWTATGRA